MTDRHIPELVVPYTLGELSPSEVAEVREHIERCEGCRREVDAVASSFAAVALTATGPAAPSRSRERLLNAIAASPAVGGSKRARLPLPLAAMQRPWWSFAPAFAAVVLAIFAILLWSNNLSLRRELEAAQQTAAQAQSRSSADLERARLIIDGLTAPYSQRVTLVSTAQRPQPSARALYMPTHHALVLMAHDLPPVPQGKAYELWIMPKNGEKPMPCGMFHPDRSGSVVMTLDHMTDAPEAKGFAVTVEDAGGSPTPTMPAVLSSE